MFNRYRRSGQNDPHVTRMLGAWINRLRSPSLDPPCKLCRGNGSYTTTRTRPIIRQCGTCFGTRKTRSDVATAWEGKCGCEKDPNCCWCPGNDRIWWKECTVCHGKGKTEKQEQRMATALCRCSFSPVKQSAPGTAKTSFARSKAGVINRDPSIIQRRKG